MELCLIRCGHNVSLCACVGAREIFCFMFVIKCGLFLAVGTVSKSLSCVRLIGTSFISKMLPPVCDA